LVAAKFIWLKILVPNKFGTTDKSTKYGFILGFARGAMLLRSWLQRQLKQPLHWTWQTVWGVGSSQIYLAEIVHHLPNEFGSTNETAFPNRS